MASIGMKREKKEDIVYTYNLFRLGRFGKEKFSKNDREELRRLTMKYVSTYSAMMHVAVINRAEISDNFPIKNIWNICNVRVCTDVYVRVYVYVYICIYHSPLITMLYHGMSAAHCRALSFSFLLDFRFFFSPSCPCRRGNDPPRRNSVRKKRRDFLRGCGILATFTLRDQDRSCARSRRSR